MDIECSGFQTGVSAADTVGGRWGSTPHGTWPSGPASTTSRRPKVRTTTLEQRARPSPRALPSRHVLTAERCVHRLLVQAGDGLFNRRAQVLLVRQRRRCQRRSRRRSLTVARWTRTVLPPPDSPPSS